MLLITLGSYRCCSVWKSKFIIELDALNFKYDRCLRKEARINRSHHEAKASPAGITHVLFYKAFFFFFIPFSHLTIGLYLPLLPPSNLQRTHSKGYSFCMIYQKLYIRPIKRQTRRQIASKYSGVSSTCTRILHEADSTFF